MKKNTIYLIIIFIIAALPDRLASQNLSNYYDPKIRTNSENVPLDNTQYYFPISLLIDTNWQPYFNNDVKIDKLKISIESANFRDKWYSEFLYNFNEPLLFNQIIHKETFRFTWLRTFHNPIVIRIEKLNKDIIMIIKQSNGQGGYEFGNLIIDKTINISYDDWLTFNNLIVQYDFWRQPSTKKVFGYDGAEWILEAANENNYHFVNRWTPENNEESAFKEACLFLLKLSGLNVKAKDIY